MRPLSASLLAAQRSASAVPYVRVRLSDFDIGVPRLRWQRWYTGAEADGPCAAAVAIDGALLRARIEPGSGTLACQRVAAPAPSSDYAAWSALGTAAVAPRLGLAVQGTRALLVAVRADGVTVEARESTDSGATFGAASTVAVAGAAVSAVACALLDATGTAAVFFAANGVVYVAERTGTAPWSAPQAWTLSLASVSGLAALGTADYEVLVSGIDAAGGAVAWTTRYGAGGGAPRATWLSPLTLAEASPGTSVTYLATGLAVAGTPRAALVESYAGTGAYGRVHLASTVAGAGLMESGWRDAMPFGHTSPYGVAIAARGAHAYLAAPDGVWHADVVTAFVDVSDDVLEVDLHQSLDGPGRLRLVLRNDHGRFAEGGPQPAPTPGSELDVAPGYVTAEGPEASGGPHFWVTRVTRRRARGVSVVELEAVDAWGVLRAWRAPRQLVWPADSASAATVAAEFLRHAGLDVLGLGSAESGSLRPAFTVRPGEDGVTALRRLLDALPDEARPDFHWFQLFEPTPGEAPVYAYGTDHPITAIEVARGRPGAGWARVFGAGVVAEAVDEAALLAGGGAAIAVDDNVTTQPGAETRASGVLRASGIRTPRGSLTVPVNAGQEVGDVIEVTDGVLGLAAQRFRVAALRLRYSRGGDPGRAAASKPRYDLELTLSEV